MGLYHSKKSVAMGQTDEDKAPIATDRQTHIENSTISTDVSDTKYSSAAGDQTDDGASHTIMDRTGGNQPNVLVDLTNRDKPTDATLQIDGKLQEGISALESLTISDTKQLPEVPDKVLTTHYLIHEYLLSNAPEYNEVHKLRQIVSATVLSFHHRFLVSPRKAC